MSRTRLPARLPRPGSLVLPATGPRLSLTGAPIVVGDIVAVAQAVGHECPDDHDSHADNEADEKRHGNVEGFAFLEAVRERSGRVEDFAALYHGRE